MGDTKTTVYNAKIATVLSGLLSAVPDGSSEHIWGLPPKKFPDDLAQEIVGKNAQIEIDEDGNIKTLVVDGTPIFEDYKWVYSDSEPESHPELNEGMEDNMGGEDLDIETDDVVEENFEIEDKDVERQMEEKTMQDDNKTKYNERRNREYNNRNRSYNRSSKGNYSSNYKRSGSQNSKRSYNRLYRKGNDSGTGGEIRSLITEILRSARSGDTMSMHFYTVLQLIYDSVDDKYKESVMRFANFAKDVLNNR